MPHREIILQDYTTVSGASHRLHIAHRIQNRSTRVVPTVKVLLFGRQRVDASRCTVACERCVAIDSRVRRSGRHANDLLLVFLFQ